MSDIESYPDPECSDTEHCTVPESPGISSQDDSDMDVTVLQGISETATAENSAADRKRPETSGKSRKSTEELELRSQRTVTHMDTSGDDTEGDVEPQRSGTSTHRVKSEVHVPHHSHRRRSRVRFADVSDDTYYTCGSTDEDEVMDRRANAEGRRRSSGRDRLKQRRRGHRQGGESPSDSDEEDSLSQTRRFGPPSRRRGDEEGDYKPAQLPHTSRRRVSPQSSSSDRNVNKVKMERKTSKPVSSRTGHSLVNVKLGKYDGSTCLATFLAKFENCSQYYSWDKEDRLFQLRASLEGPAGQILWDASHTHTVKSIIRLLRARFGSEGQPERFRAELRARRRRPGESLQSLYQDICRLIALAYPGPSSSLLRIVGRDAFLDALNDPGLRVRILEWEPIDLDEALQLASRFEVYGKSVSTVTKEEANGERKRSRGRPVRAVTSATKSTDTDENVRKLSKQVAELQTALAKCQQELKRKNESPPVKNEQAVASEMSAALLRPDYAYVATPWGAPGTGQAQPPPAPAIVWAVPLHGKPASPDEVSAHAPAAEPSSADSKVCYGCRQTGHFRRSCPNRQTKGVKVFDAGVKHVAGPNPPAEVYIRAQLGGREVNCLLDTGSETYSR